MVEDELDLGLRKSKHEAKRRAEQRKRLKHYKPKIRPGTQRFKELQKRMKAKTQQTDRRPERLSPEAEREVQEILKLVEPTRPKPTRINKKLTTEEEEEVDQAADGERYEKMRRDRGPSQFHQRLHAVQKQSRKYMQSATPPARAPTQQGPRRPAFQGRKVGGGFNYPKKKKRRNEK